MRNDGIGDRVRGALERAGRQARDLAERIGMSTDKMSKSLKGTRAFTSAELADISDDLHVDIYWLISGEPSRFSPRVAFRHNYDADAQEHEEPTPEMRRELDNLSRAYSQAQIPDDARFETFRREVGADQFDPNAEGLWKAVRPVSQKVRRIWRAWIDAGHDPVLDMEEFLSETAGIDLAVLDGEESAKVQTYALQVDEHQVIVSSRSAAWYSAVFGIFHELAHLLFGDADWEGAPARVQEVHPEALANGFAADVLIGWEQIKGTSLDEAPVKDVAELLWGDAVSIHVLRNRCTSAGCSAPSDHITQRRIAQAWHTAHPDRASEREAHWQRPTFPQRLVDAHEQASASGDVPPDLYAWMKQMPVEDVVASQPEIELDDSTRAMLEELGIPA